MAVKLTLVTLALLTSLAIFITAAYLIPSTERPAALLGAGVGLTFVTVLVAVLFRRGLIVPILIFVLMSLTACNDPFGLVAREQIRTQGAIEIAQIDAATTRATAAARIGGMVAVVGIMAMAAIAISMVGGATHIVAQRDRLTAEQWRAQLPMQQPAQPSRRIHDRQPATGHWLALRRPDSQQRQPTLALPERSASASHDVIIIDG